MPRIRPARLRGREHGFGPLAAQAARPQVAPLMAAGQLAAITDWAVTKPCRRQYRVAIPTGTRGDESRAAMSRCPSTR